MQNKAFSKPKINCKETIDAFYHVNQQRIDKTREYLSRSQSSFLDLLPFLFHYNHESIPGFISEHTPSGISQYSPLQPTIQLAKKHFKNYNHNRRAKHQMDLQAMFFMGSAGTIAYTNKSDFDVWLIHTPELDTFQLDELAQKAKAIEEWAGTLKLEVHFFIFDAESFRSGQHQSLSTESSGSTQHSLLLDEFYRSSILIAGRFPIWWLVPTENEHEYENYIGTLFYGNLVNKNDVIDLGTSCPVPSSEFFGAAVWQLYKGISSPYKSVLKLLLMEVYASEHPKTELLSTRFKRYIYKRESDISVLDPYIIMYKVVEEYLMKHNDDERLQIFRECFYFKIGEKLSIPELKKKKTLRRKLLEEMTYQWGWDQSNFSLLDMHDKWRVDNISYHRKNIIHTLTKSYQFLSDFARQNAEVYRVNQTELNVLGRKLYAAFEKKNNKIEIVNYETINDLHETEVTIQQTQNKNNQSIWLLYRGHINFQNQKEYKPLKRTKDIMELLVWCHLNRVVNQHSAISLNTINYGITTRELKDTFYALSKLFPSGKIYEPTFNDLSNPAAIINAGIFVNVGIDPFNCTIEGARHVASSRLDALSYGGQHQNLAKSFDLVLITSWEEVLVYHYDGMKGLMQCLCDYMTWTPNKEVIPSTSLTAFSLSSSYGRNISQRIEYLFRDIINQVFYKNKEHKSIRYIIKAEDNYHVLESDPENIGHKSFRNVNNLQQYLALPVNHFTQIFFDDKKDWNSKLPNIYKLNRKSVIQTFYTINNAQVDIDVIDEKGSLFSQTMPYHNTQSLICHFRKFYESILKRKNFITGTIVENDSIDIEFYEIKENNNRLNNIIKVDVKPNTQSNLFFNLQVIGSLDEKDKNSLTIYCNNEEFSSLEHGNNVLSVVAEYVLSKRPNGEPYPIYITDIDFSRGLLDVIEPKNLQFTHFLKYKKMIEEKLNLALAELAK